MTRIPRPDETSDMHEVARLLETDVRGAHEILEGEEAQPAFYSNGRPHYRTADIRLIVGRRSRPMY